MSSTIRVYVSPSSYYKHTFLYVSALYIPTVSNRQFFLWSYICKTATGFLPADPKEATTMYTSKLKTFRSLHALLMTQSWTQSPYVRHVRFKSSFYITSGMSSMSAKKKYKTATFLKEFNLANSKSFACYNILWNFLHYINEYKCRIKHGATLNK